MYSRKPSAALLLLLWLAAFEMVCPKIFTPKSYSNV